MSKKTADRHSLCASYPGFDCDIDTRCEECMEWPEEEVRLYAKYRKSLKSKTSSKSKSSAPPPSADSVPSPQPSPCGDIESRVEPLSATVANLAEFVHSKLDALTSSLRTPSLTQVSSQPWLGPDVRDRHPGSTTGCHHQLQALGGPDRTPVVPPTAPPSVSQGVRAPSVEQSGSAFAPPPEAAPGAALHPSVAYANRLPPPSFEVPLSQPSTSGWVPSGPLPSRSAPDSCTSSESEDSDTGSDISSCDSVSSRLADLIYEVFPESHPVADAACLPLCGFEVWFGQPESASSRQRFRLYPRVAEAESKVCLFVWRLWLSMPSPSLMFCLVGRGSMRWPTTRFLLPRYRLTLRSRSSLGPEP